jgi:hypothetical protein
MIFALQCTGELLVVVTEGADRVGTTRLTTINHNRNCTSTGETLVHRGVTGGTTDGATTVYTVRVGATGLGARAEVPGMDRAVNEFVLKQNTKYVITVTTYAAVQVSLELDWYEHSDINDAFNISESASISPSVSQSLSPSKSPSLSLSISLSLSPSISPSISLSISPSISPSISLSISPSESPSISLSISPSISLSISPSESPSESISPSTSPSISLSVSPSESLSVSPSISPSPSGA